MSQYVLEQMGNNDGFVVWFVVVDTKAYGGAPIVVSSGASSSLSTYDDLARQYGSDRYQIVLFNSAAAQESFFAELRAKTPVATAAAKTGGTVASGMSTTTKVAIGAAAVVGAYFLFFKRGR